MEAISTLSGKGMQTKEVRLRDSVGHKMQASSDQSSKVAGIY